MLESSFIHGDGVGPATERRIWNAGGHTWEAFLDLNARGAIPGRRMDALANLVAASRRALDQDDVAFFSRRLHVSEQWRLFTRFGRRAAFVDIETTGLSP
mgnify:FL=1